MYFGESLTKGSEIDIQECFLELMGYEVLSSCRSQKMA